MISKSISTSARLSDVSTFSALLFTWLIPHCDDYGHMDGSARMVKGIVVPLREENVAQVEESLKELEKSGLIRRYEIDKMQYLEIEKWEDHQTLKNDRPAHQVYPLPLDWNPNNSSRIPEVSKRNDKRREVKRSEVKLSEDKRKDPTRSMGYLTAIPAEDMKKFLDRFVATKEEIESKAEDLKLYCERKGKTYNNYQSFLLNALKRDFKERKTAKASKYDKIAQPTA